MDVKNAFLQGNLEEQVYMIQRPRFQSEFNKSEVYQLKKLIYSLKQAPRAWNGKIMQRLRKIGFQASIFDTSLFIRKGRQIPICIVLYVNDLVITRADLADIEVSIIGNIWDAGSWGPSLLPQDWSDMNPRWHIVNTKELCFEYAIQIRHDELTICHNSSRYNTEALP